MLLKEQSNLGPYCLQYRLHMKEQTKISWGNCKKYKINSLRKNNHNSLPKLYPSRQTHAFNLDDENVNGQTDEQMATTPAHALGYIKLLIGYFTC